MQNYSFMQQKLIWISKIMVWNLNHSFRNQYEFKNIYEKKSALNTFSSLQIKA